jgi:hypothetical protein
MSFSLSAENSANKPRDDDDPVEVFRRLVQAVEQNDLRGVKTLTRELRCLGWGCTLLSTGGRPK